MAVAVVVLLTQATTWLHTAATPHVTCVEHGESVHLQVSAASVTGRGAPLAIDAIPADPAAHAHEHCGLQGPRATSTTAPARGVTATTRAPAALVAIVQTPPPQRLLRLAPKTSPPRAPVV